MSDIGDYQDVKYLGCGTFGTVSLVTCRQDGRQVSIPTMVLFFVRGSHRLIQGHRVRF